jgi:hypothetical protein
MEEDSAELARLLLKRGKRAFRRYKRYGSLCRRLIADGPKLAGRSKNPMVRQPERSTRDPESRALSEGENRRQSPGVPLK